MDSRPWLNYSIHTPTTPTPNNVARKTRKPYTLTKEKEYWTDLEHDKFVEAVELFGRDWRKIAAFVGKKTAKQINSHAQKHFKKIKKDGTNEYIPPPRPKKKAAHPYPRKAIQNAMGALQSSSPILELGCVVKPDSSSLQTGSIAVPVVSSSVHDSVPPVNMSHVTTVPILSQAMGAFQFSSILEPGYDLRPDSSSLQIDSIAVPVVSSLAHDSVPAVGVSHMETGATIVQNCCGSMDSTPTACLTHIMADMENQTSPLRGTPDFAEVCRYIGSVFDPNSCDHFQKLEEMDPIDFEAALLFMDNICSNLLSPDFEDHFNALLN